MKILSKKKALVELKKLKNNFREIIKENYEFKAKDCSKCNQTCCLDAKFVNVHITKLEAILIHDHLREKYPQEKAKQINEKVKEVIERFDIARNMENSSHTFPCPFFEQGSGCLIHEVKPIACIQHACYEKSEDLPPEKLQAEIERKIERLNERTYGKPSRWFPLPIWIALTKEEG
ncbi:MAG: hypothetical protein N2Z23_08975 [Pyrinomonadaceae bacterium]|nr:hypothetical protein [Pyrinomonadaceae bacterium]MCX7640554.1 hypothetical protein [Pyrinomonadaceae bacterium]MDW8303865.1 hypothetical protein [Acidobacteriota bacterium]